jgi:hypothetical protein
MNFSSFLGNERIMRILGSAVSHGGASTLVNDEKEPWRWWFEHKDAFA